jgi:hypothetical protein
VLRLVRRLADHPDGIYVRVRREQGWVSPAYADLTPEEQAEWLVKWTAPVVDGWEGPYRVPRATTDAYPPC